MRLSRLLPTYLLPLFVLMAPVACNKSDGGGGEGDAGFDITPNGRGFSMTLSKDSLGKTYLLSPALGTGFPLPLTESFTLVPRIVKFEQADGDLFMFEDSAKQVSTTSLPAYKLLARFHVEDADDATITFDFNEGVQGYLVKGIEDAYMLPTGTLELQNSYMNKVYFKDNKLYADQVLEMRGDTANQTAQIKYTMEPYTERTDFPSRSGLEAFAKVGYFTNLPLYFNERGQTKEYINKWDRAAPIVFSLSPSVPEKYRQAVRDGVLYWNRAFGAEAVVIQDLPEGITPHEPGYNVIQWVESDEMPYAYADFRTDPRTGQILQAQIFMSNAFTDNLGISLPLLPEAAEKPATTKLKSKTWRDLAVTKPLFGIGRNMPHKSCFDGFLRDARKHGGLMMMGLSPAQVDVVAGDIVRMVIAHEVGHTMGLRHNFTAKNGAEMPVDEYDAALKAYLKDGTPPTKSLTTSVMDYTQLTADAMIGATIRAGAAALKYDVAAMSWGYGTADFRTIDFGGFCSDEMLGATEDCNVFTAAGDVLAANLNDFLKTADRAAADLVVQFILAKAPPNLTEPKPLEELALDPEGDAYVAADGLRPVVGTLKDFKASQGTLFRIYDTFKVVSVLNREDEEKALLAYQKSAVKAVGGIDAILKPLRVEKQDDGTYLPGMLADMEAKFLALLARPEVIKNTTARGQEYEFTAEELAFMKATAKKYFAKFADTFVQATISVVAGGGGGDFGDDFGGGSSAYAAFDKAGLATELKALGDAIITAESSKDVTGTVTATEVTVKDLYYKKDLMIAAAAYYSTSLMDLYPDTFNEGASAEATAALDTKIGIIDLGGAADSDDMPTKLKKLYLDLSDVRSAVEDAAR